MEFADVVHGEGAKNAEGGHDHKPEGVAVLGLGDFQNPTGEGQRDGGAVVLEGVDHACRKARHFLSPDIHRGGRADDGVGGVCGKGDEDKDGATEDDSPGRRTHVALEKNHRRHGNHHRFDNVEGHGHRGAVSFEKTVGNPSRQKRPGHGHQRHQFESAAGCIRDVGFHVKTELVLKIEDGDLIRAGADGSGAGVGDGIEPDERVSEDGLKGFYERNGDPFGVVDFILNGAREARFIRRGLSGKVHKDCGNGGEEGRDTKEPAPLSGRNGESEERKAGKDEGSKEADGDLAQLDHEAENS